MLEKLASNKLFDGLQLQYQHHSQLLACTMRFSVYLPPQAPQSLTRMVDPWRDPSCRASYATAMQQISSVSVAARRRPNVHEPGIVSPSHTVLDIMSRSNGIATGQS